VVGERHLKLRLRLPDGELIEAIGFGLGEAAVSAGDRVRLAYRLAVNEYRGIRSPQLIMEHIDAVSETNPIPCPGLPNNNHC